MRTATVAERDQLAAAGLNVHVKAEVTDSEGNYVDVSTLAGLDWLVSASWSEDIDQPVLQGQVRLVRGGGTLSLSPLMTGSTINRDSGSAYAPFLDAGRRIRLSTAVTAPGVAPAAGDWKEMLQGKVDEIEWGADPLVISFRDLGAVLQDTIIEVERVYGTDAGIASESVMQQILDDNLGAGAVTLVTPTPSAWAIKPYIQERVSVLEALRTIALQRGWDVRYTYDAAGNYVLMYFEPDRAKSVPDATIGPTEYLDIANLSISDADVRTVVGVTYQNKTTGLVETVFASAAGPIAEFGRRYMEIGNGSTNAIDTHDEAQTMATAAVNDLSTPKATQVVSMLYWWPTQLGDLYRWTANGVHYDTDQDFAITGYQHEISGGDGRTTMRVRGTVAGAYRQWLLTRNGLYDARPVTGPVPIIGPIGGEGSAFGGGPTREGMIWLAIKFSKSTDSIEIYGVENIVPNVAVPEIAENRKCWSVRRQDGAVASADEWATWIMVATRTGYYRKLIVFALDATGARGPTTVLEAQAIDVGTGPTAPPSGVTVKSSGTTNQIAFTVGDAEATHLILRNGFVIKELPKGQTAFDDTDLQSTVPYTYAVCAFRSFQTSELVGTTTIPPSSANANAPHWQSGFPKSIATGIEFAWTADPSAVSVTIQWFVTIVGGGPMSWADLTTPYTGATYIPNGDVSLGNGQLGTYMTFRLKQIMPDGSEYYSETATVRWGLPPLVAPVLNAVQPIGVSGGGTEYVFQWSLSGTGATQLDIEFQDSLTGDWGPVHSVTDPATIANGTWQTSLSGYPDLAQMRARAVAIYPNGTAPSASRPIGSFV